MQKSEEREVYDMTLTVYTFQRQTSINVTEVDSGFVSEQNSLPVSVCPATMKSQDVPVDVDKHGVDARSPLTRKRCFTRKRCLHLLRSIAETVIAANWNRVLFE